MLTDNRLFYGVSWRIVLPDRNIGGLCSCRTTGGVGPDAPLFKAFGSIVLTRDASHVSLPAPQINPRRHLVGSYTMAARRSVCVFRPSLVVRTSITLIYCWANESAIGREIHSITVYQLGIRNFRLIFKNPTQYYRYSQWTLYLVFIHLLFIYFIK